MDSPCLIPCVQCKQIKPICCDVWSDCSEKGPQGECLKHESPTCRACCHDRPTVTVDCPTCRGSGKVQARPN